MHLKPPNVSKEVDLSKCVPLIFHCDDGEAHRRRSFMIASFGSAVVHGSRWNSRYLLYCTDNAKCTHQTFDLLDTWLAWSFTELGAGKWLQHSPWNEHMENRTSKCGMPIAGPWRGILFAHRGDEKALAKSFHVKNTWISPDVCFTCLASRLSNSVEIYTAFGRNAHHRQTILGLHDFIQNTGSNAWCRVPGFHPSMILYDWLHVLDLSLIPDASASAARLHIAFTIIMYTLALLSEQSVPGFIGDM